MSIINALIKLRAVVGLLMLICITPILILAAILSKICCVKTTKSVAGEVALVTGAAHGLGRAIALELARMGCHLAIVDIDLSGATETVNQINELHSVKAKAYKVNVASYSELIDLKMNITNDLGPVSILINNAGILLINSSEPHDIQRMIDVNLMSHFWTKNVFLPTMKQLRKGHIVTISSIAGLIPLPYHSTYTATKFGANGHMKALRIELSTERQHNIHVTTVMPWFLQTNDNVSEIVNNLYIHHLYPLISGAAAARRIVEGMLCGEREIILPTFVAIIYRILVLLPVSWQESMFPLVFHKIAVKLYQMQA